MADERLIFPLEERIGEPDLLVGRQAAFAEYEQWISRMPRKLSKSRVIMARKKSGKTAFIQRLYNRVWQANGPVVPFFIEIKENRVWFPDLAMTYFLTFASQYISFLERDPDPVGMSLTPDEIRQYGREHDLDYLTSIMDTLEENREKGLHDVMWYTAINAPHALATKYGRPVVVMIDEFQNLSGYVCTDKAKTQVDETVPGSFHELSESKVAPMLATGSAVGWLDRVLNKYLEFGRLSPMPFSPYLTAEEGLETVYRYARHYEEAITNQTALIISDLCCHDPYFIACVFRSNCPERDLTTPVGVVRTIDFETTNERAELLRGWRDWFRKALPRINQYHGKRMLMFLSRHPEKMFNATELKREQKIELTIDEIRNRLEKLYEAELVTNSWSRYGGLNDGTFYLLLQRHLEEEMEELDLEPDPSLMDRVENLIREKRALQNRLNNAEGRLAEAMLEIDMRTRQRFKPSVYFEGLPEDPLLVITCVFPRYYVQAPGVRRELDLRIDGEGGLTLLVEVKKMATPINIQTVQSFAEKVSLFEEMNPEQRTLAAILSLGGFTKEAETFCQAQGIGCATHLPF